MCGIAGLFEYSINESTINEKLLKNMSDVITHRGPDSDGQWISEDKTCGFTFRRLAIIDLSPAGNQPMHTPDKRLTIVFNGEIYNHAEIRKELIQKGYKYKSQTDTETILYGYLEWGEGILDKMLGMWDFVIYDNLKKEIFGARDRIGVKPLYFSNKNGRFIFGSEIKSILQHPSIRKEMNLDELPNYLNFGLSSREESLFKGIKKIPAGHYFKLDLKGNFEIKRYWSPFKNESQYTNMNEKELQEETLSLLRKSVDARMMSDVPFGVFLSGGIDSSVNVALMAELMNRPVDTFTVGFKELEKYNELKYARKISEIFKTNHKEILIDSKDSLPILDKLAFHEDEPNADPVCIPLWFLSKLTRDSGTIVVQVGEGSDEQFAGYPWMIQHYNFHNSYWKAFKSLPKFARKAVHSSVKPLFSMMNQHLALDFVRRAAHDEEFYWSGVSIFSPTHLSLLFNDKLKSKIGIPAEYASKMHNDSLSMQPNADYFQRMLFLELSQRLAEILLMRVDKIGMAHSIEARVPFLDHRLVEFTMSIPPKMKMPDGKTTKYILKKAVESILPNDIIYRKKQGFAAPVSEWLANDWKTYSQDKILNSRLIKENILDKKYINNLLVQHYSAKKNNNTQIFSLLMLCVWYDVFFEGK